MGDLTFDGGRRLLRRGADRVHLSPKAFQLLALLLVRRPEVLPRGEIVETLWRGTRVTDGNLASIVSELRHALGEEGRSGSWVRTVHGFGYAFDRPAVEVPGIPQHVLVRGRREVELPPGGNTLGRKREASVRIGHPSVAPEHARIAVADDQAVLSDPAGDGSTFRGREPVRSRVLLEDGDEIRIGEVTLTYRIRTSAGGA